MNPINKPSVGIIGGKGQMAQKFKALFEREGCFCAISDILEGKSIPELVSSCKVIGIAVPISVTLQVIKEVVPLMHPDQLLFDLTSLKEQPMQAMSASLATVIGLHPLFGPKEKLENQTIVVCSNSSSDWLNWLLALFKKQSMHIVELSSKEHDEYMAVIQALTHFQALTFGLVIQDYSEELLIKLATPSFEKIKTLLDRIRMQDGLLYRDIAFYNPYFPKVLQRLREFIDKLENSIVTKNSTAFMQLFDQIRNLS